MADWTTNTMMFWNNVKVTDHNREALNVANEKIGDDKRMIDGTLRRYIVANKRTWSASWTNLPSVAVTGGMPIAGGGMGAYEMDQFYRSTPGQFVMIIRKGSAMGKTLPTNVSLPYEDSNFYIASVMFQDFDISIAKRGIRTDLVNVNVSLVEV